MDMRAFDDLARPWPFDELVREGVSLIPAHAPNWTNHNPSDPGITLVELFAYFGEILAYRALRITPDAKLHFLRLLEGGDARADGLRPGVPSEDVDDAIRARVRALSQSLCTVTPHDFEQAAVALARKQLGEHDVVRAHAVVGVDLRHGGAAGSAAAEAVGDVSVILAPEREPAHDMLDRLCRGVEQELAKRCLLTTHVHVVGPVYLHVFIGCRLALKDGVTLAAAVASIDQALRRRFGPASADDTEAADVRPFGDALHLSEVAEVIDRSEGVDWVDAVTVHRMGERSGGTSRDALIGLRIGSISTIADDTRLGGVVSVERRRLQRDADGELQSVLLRPWELVRVHLDREALVRVAEGSP